MKVTNQTIEEFAQFLQQEEKSGATQEKYLRDVRAFCAFSKGEEVDKGLMMAWKRALVERGYAARSVNSMLASVNCLLRFMNASSCKVKNIRIQQKTYCPESEELTKEEYFRLLDAAKTDTQLLLLLQTICGTGIRVSELVYFTVEMVRGGEVVIDCKGKTRTIIVPDRLRSLLLNYAGKRGISAGIIFCGKNGQALSRSCIWRKLKKLCAAAQVAEEKVFPHNLRKLFARTFYGAEKDIAKLADVLGHSNINTTRIYIMTTGSEHRRQINRLGLVI